jgi:hypothetical protein
MIDWERYEIPIAIVLSLLTIAIIFVIEEVI